MPLTTHPLPDRFSRRLLAVAFVVCLAVIAQTLGLGVTAQAAEAEPVTYQGQSYTSASSNPTGGQAAEQAVVPGGCLVGPDAQPGRRGRAHP